MKLDEDVIGLSREARWGDEEESAEIRQKYRVCFHLLCHLSRERGVSWCSPNAEVDEVYDSVMEGKSPCPIRDTCPKYAKAVAEGKRFLWDHPDEKPPAQPRQLRMF
jgi:hypothetical protein